MQADAGRVQREEGQDQGDDPLGGGFSSARSVTSTHFAPFGKRESEAQRHSREEPVPQDRDQHHAKGNSVRVIHRRLTAVVVGLPTIASSRCRSR